MARRPAGPGPDDLDADLRASPEEILAELGAAEPAPGNELDLHHFRPDEIADLVAEFLEAARAAGHTAVRIVHGKGVGVQRRTVHAVLANHPAVASYRLADGNWGATLVELNRC